MPTSGGPGALASKVTTKPVPAMMNSSGPTTIASPRKPHQKFERPVSRAKTGVRITFNVSPQARLLRRRARGLPAENQPFILPLTIENQRRELENIVTAGEQAARRIRGHSILNGLKPIASCCPMA